MTSWEFAAAGPIEAEISVPAGEISLTATQGETVSVSLQPSHGGSRSAENLIADTEVSFENGKLTVEVPKRGHLRGDASVDLRVELPEGSSASVNTASADLRCTGELGSLSGHTASGDVTADRISGQADLSTASGDVRLADVAGPLTIQTASGDASIERAGDDVTVNSASGDVRIKHAAGSAEVKTASGDVRIDSISAGRVNTNSVSGDVTVAVPSGVGVYLDLSSLSGHVKSELDAEQDGAGRDATLTVSCRSLSGDIRITRANPS